MITKALTAWQAPPTRSPKKKTRSLSFAVTFPKNALDGPCKAGPLWITRPSLTYRARKKEIIRIVSVYPVVKATNENRPHFQWAIEMGVPIPDHPPWMPLLPAGYHVTLKSGIRVLEALAKSNSMSYRSVEGLTTLSKAGPEHVTYRLYNVKTGEEIISDILQK